MAKTLVLIVVAIIVLAASPSRSGEQAGVVVRLEGAAIAVAGETGRALATGSPVHYGERITTDADTRLRLKLIDGAVITLGDHSTFTIQGYEPDEAGTVFDITNGVFLGISGAVAERDQPLTINTPLATIGIRGTTFWGRVDPGHVQVGLIDGRRVFVKAAGRRYDLSPEANGVDVYGPDRPGGATVEQRKWAAKRIEASMKQVAF